MEIRPLGRRIESSQPSADITRTDRKPSGRRSWLCTSKKAISPHASPFLLIDRWKTNRGRDCSNHGRRNRSAMSPECPPVPVLPDHTTSIPRRHSYTRFTLWVFVDGPNAQRSTVFWGHYAGASQTEASRMLLLCRGSALSLPIYLRSPLKRPRLLPSLLLGAYRRESRRSTPVESTTTAQKIIAYACAFLVIGAGAVGGGYLMETA
jgi:hypothetical protein